MNPTTGRLEESSNIIIKYSNSAAAHAVTQAASLELDLRSLGEKEHQQQGMPEHRSEGCTERRLEPMHQPELPQQRLKVKRFSR